MKKLFVLAAAAFLAMGNAAFAQFEGTIVYTMQMDMSTMSPEQQQAMAQMGMGGANDMTILVKNGKSRTDFSMGPVSKTVISDMKEKTQVSLTDMMGTKYMVRTSLDAYKQDQAKENITFKYIDGETKTIAGYKCKKAEMTMTDKKDGKQHTMNVWYTEEFNPSSGNEFNKFNGLKGMPMEYEMRTPQGQTMSFSVKSITKGPVADSKFTIPTEGYKVYNSEEEAMKDMMKGMGGH